MSLPVEHQRKRQRISSDQQHSNKLLPTLISADDEWLMEHTFPPSPYPELSDLHADLWSLVSDKFSADDFSNRNFAIAEYSDIDRPPPIGNVPL